MDARTLRESAAAAAKTNDKQRLLALAKEYTQFLSPMFHLIPWDEKVILGNERFLEAYQVAAEVTEGFSNVTPQSIAEAIGKLSSALVVFRTIAGYRVQELAYALEYKLKVNVGEQAIRKLELEGKPVPEKQRGRIVAIAEALHAAVEGTLLPRPAEASGFFDRRAKFDTKDGWGNVAGCAAQGVPYATVLYERYLGRPFAYVVDALSSRKADLLEGPLQALLDRHKIPFYRSKAIERIPGFEQAPDFLVPGRDDPRIVIECKLAEDGGTARDKASRIERLSKTTEKQGQTLIAVVDGKGFYRINDVLAPILQITRGLTFTLSTLEEMVELPVFCPYLRG